jgi:hypothetical protein
MVEITLPIVLQILQTAGILVGIAYYLVIMRNSQKTRTLALNAQELSRKAQEQGVETRQSQLFMQIYLRGQEPSFQKRHLEIINQWEWKNYDDFNEKYGLSKSSEDYSSFMTIGSYYEGLGVLVRRKLIDPHFVDDMMSGYIIRFWEKIESLTMEMRERLNYPQVWEQIEYLYNVIKPIVEQQHPELKT